MRQFGQLQSANTSKWFWIHLYDWRIISKYVIFIQKSSVTNRIVVEHFLRWQKCLYTNFFSIDASIQISIEQHRFGLIWICRINEWIRCSCLFSAICISVAHWIKAEKDYYKQNKSRYVRSMNRNTLCLFGGLIQTILLDINFSCIIKCVGVCECTYYVCQCFFIVYDMTSVMENALNSKPWWNWNNILVHQ